MKKLNKAVLAFGIVAGIFGAILFWPTSRFQISRSANPTGKATLVAVTQPQTSQSGVSNSSTDLFIEDAAGARNFWFRCENGTFHPNDYFWSKDGSLIAAEMNWSIQTNRMDYSQGRGFLLSVDVINGERQDFSGNMETFSAPSPAGLRVIPQTLVKRGGAVTATWRTAKDMSWFQRLSYSQK